MQKALASLVLLALPSLAAAGSVEITGFAGRSFPFYSQTFSYDPGPISIAIPGVTIQQSGAFQANASGGFALGGSVTLYPAEAIGLELRLDSASVSVQPQNATFDVNLTLPSPLAPIKSNLTLTQGTVDIDSARPFSLNLKLRTPGSTHVFASGGLSRLGELNFSAQQTVALGVTAVNLQTSNLEIGTIGLKAARTDAQKGGSWGGNVGAGVQIALGERGGLVLEARGFYFPKQTIDWEPVIVTPLDPLPSQLLQRLLERLNPVEFKPWWVQATIGVSYRF